MAPGHSGASRFRSSLPRPHLIVARPRCGVSCTELAPGCSFQVGWSINPHMKIGAVRPERAAWQHDAFVRELRRAGAHVTHVPFVHGAYDSVFSKDNAVLVQRADGRTHALLARPRHPERSIEQERRAASYAALGIHTDDVAAHLEGGDVVMLPGGAAFLGFGFRSDRDAARELASFLGHGVTCLELTDPRLYHLDMVVSVLADGTALVCLEALTPRARHLLATHEAIRTIVPVPIEEALCFGVNLVEIGANIVWGAAAPTTTKVLEERGYRVRSCALDEFHLAGGSAACLVARVHVLDDQEELAPESTAA